VHGEARKCTAEPVETNHDGQDGQSAYISIQWESGLVSIPEKLSYQIPIVFQNDNCM